MSFPVPPDESGRLAALQDLAILDTGPEPLYDDVAALAAAICRTPIAVVNFVDADRQWGKALVGLDSSEAPREQSFCARAIVADDGMLIVPDTLGDAAWADNAMVLGDPYLRFYAGATIHADGHAVGTLCVADHTPRELDAEQLGALEVLARQTSANLELRLRTRALADANAELRLLAVHDGLTGLANRTLLYDRVEHALACRARTAAPIGVLFGDLDGFKQINDMLGHRAGDEVLRAVAARLALAARSSDTVARLAGDEFVVVCEALTDAIDLGAVADRLSHAVARPVPGIPGVVIPQISFGAALAQDGDDAERLIARADAAMYVVKQRRGAERVPVLR